MTREEAINEIKSWAIPSEKGREVLETLIPELKESEDEKVRKEIIEVLQFVPASMWEQAKTNYERCFAYLEKQKEQKPVEHSAKGRRGRMGGIPEYVRRKAEAFKDKMEPPYDADDICTAYEAGALESAKPAELEQLAKLREMTHEIRDAYERGIEVGRVESKQEWSEEDKEMLNSCISSIEESKENRYAYKETDGDTSYDHEIAWLKSLRPVSKESLQPHWKPSEEQMESLAYAIQVLNSNPHPKSAKAYQDLQTLYKNIKYGN